MGSSQSTESEPPSTRPPSSRRLSSFGRPALNKSQRRSSKSVKDDTLQRRKSRNEVEVVDKGKGKAKEEESVANIDNHILDSTPTTFSQPVITTIPATTPSLPTSRGPPVLSKDDRRLSYFPSLTSPSLDVVEPENERPTTRPSTPYPVSALPRDHPSRSSSTPLPSPSIPVSPASPAAPSRPSHQRTYSVPAFPTSPQSMTGRLTALLGFSAPGDPSSSFNSPSSSTTTAPTTSSPLISSSLAPPTTTSSAPSSTTQDLESTTLENPPRISGNRDLDDLTLNQLQERLDRARQELEESQAQLNRVQAQRRRAEEDIQRRQTELDRNNRIPVGAMLVIQGLAQTHIAPSDENEDEDGNIVNPGNGPSRPTHRRRTSEGSIFRRRREEQRQRGASIEQQARMISGLLTVAAAATANTLLNNEHNRTPSLPTPPRPGIAGAIDSLMNRLRPSRNPRQGIEAALGQYLRNVVRDNRHRSGENVTLPPIGPDGRGGGSDFQDFLQTLSGDLVGAVRAYARSTRTDDASSVSNVSAAESTDEEVDVTEEIVDDAETEQSRGASATGDAEAEVTAIESTSTPQDQQPPPEVSTIPTFHHQEGQNLPSSRPNLSGVTGGESGSPRRLNFFRAHLFPPIPSRTGPSPTSEAANQPSSTAVSTSSTSNDPSSSSTVTPGPSTSIDNPSEDQDTIIPCIFVGVRSIRTEPGATPEELFNQPGVFGGDGPVPGASPSPSTSSSSTTTPNPSSHSRPELSRVTPRPTTNRSFRERFLSRVSRRPSSSLPTSTYLVYVIGGNYPRNHPILRIPNLITGGPLTDEDMQLISELMGPAKPPTASKEEIEKSGLKLIDGSKMKELGEKGEIMDNCVERCLICLSEYEEGEECRVLGCRHGFHKDCVDHWLESGSNSCPACRTEAIDKTKMTPSTSTSSTDPTSTDSTPTVTASATTAPPRTEEGINDSYDNDLD